MNSRYDLVDLVYKDKTPIKNFIDRETIESVFLDGNEFTIVLPQGFNYRPDKLADYFYQTPEYGWIFLYVNNFENGLEDFYEGREIIVPHPNRVRNYFGGN